MKRWEPWRIEEHDVLGERQLLFHNNRYHVFLRKRPAVEPCPYGTIWLSIRNNDRSTRRDWRDFQRIKNEIVGAEFEMIEMYPREGHKVDMSNQYHLWGFDTTDPVFTNMGFGWAEGKKVWDGKTVHNVPGTEKAKQRPTDEESTV